MKLFGNGKRTKRPYRKPTSDEIDRKEARKEKQTARAKFQEMIKDNPEAERKWVSKMMGIDLEPTNPIERHKQAIDALVTEKALEEIKKDPELVKEFARRKLEDIIGEISTEQDEGYDGSGYRDSPLSQAIDTIDEYETLKGRLGAKSGPLGGLVDAEVIKMALQSAPQFLAAIQGKSLPVPPTKYLIEVDGVLHEMDAIAYKNLLEQRETKRLEIGKEKPGAEEEVESELAPELEAEHPSFNLDFWTEYLDGDSSEVIFKLMELKETGDVQAIYVLDLFQKLDAMQVLTLLLPFKSNEKYKESIEKLETQTEWLQEAIDFYRETTQYENLEQGQDNAEL